MTSTTFIKEHIFTGRVKRGKSDRLDIVCVPELNNMYLVRKNTGAKI